MTTLFLSVVDVLSVKSKVHRLIFGNVLVKKHTFSSIFEHKICINCAQVVRKLLITINVTGE